MPLLTRLLPFAAHSQTVLSKDGASLVFESASDGLINGDNNGVSDLYLQSAAEDALVCISRDAGGALGNGASSQPAFCASQDLVAFASLSSNFSEQDSNNNADIYLKNLRTDQLSLISAGWQNSQSNGASSHPSLSENGYLAFESTASNLIAVDSNGQSDIFCKDLNLDQMRLVSSNAQGQQGNGASTHALLSADGRFVAFESEASNLIANDSNGKRDIFLKDMHTGGIERINLSAKGQQDTGDARLESISADARYIAFSSTGAQLVAGDTNQARDIFVKDRSSGAVVRASVDAKGQQANGDSFHAQFSEDGRYLVFSSNARNLALDSTPDTQTHTNVFFKDLQTAALTRLSQHTINESGASITVDSDMGAISGNGQSMVFSSERAANDGGTAQNAYPFAFMARLAQADSANTPVRHISGSAAADLLHGNAGNDDIDGGDGCDTVAYNAAHSNYFIEQTAGGFNVTDLRGPDGSDTLRNIERLTFSDGSLALDIDGAAGQAFRIYQAAFNRAADKGGLGFWINTLDHGASVQSMAEGFMHSAEFAKLYGAQPSSAQLVEKFYANVLHRAIDQEGYAFWLGVLEHHQASPAQVLLSFAESAENKAALIGVVQHGIEYTPLV